MKIMGNRIYIRYFEDEDAEALHNLNLRNKEFFQKHSPTIEDGFYSLDTQRKIIKDKKRHSEEGRQHCFGIFLKSSDELLGDVSLFQIIRGSLQSCLVGYSLDEEHNGNGYTTEAVSLAVKYGFEELKLHRIEAGVMPENVGSIRVLEKVGFHKEGIAQKNVKINGKWEDHQILAIISPND